MIAAFLFAIAYTLTPIFKDTVPGNIELIRFPMGFVGFLLLRYFLDLVLDKISKSKALIKADYKLSDKKVFFISFIVFFAVGFIYQLAYYPGTISFDTAQVLMFGMEVANQHPWIYCAFVVGLQNLVHALGYGESIVVFIMCFLQIIAAALVMAHVISHLKKSKVPNVFLLLIGISYLLSPVIFIYLISPMKDVIFALAVVEWVLLLHECHREPEKVFGSKVTYIRILLLIVFSLTRSNGIYVAFATLVASLICFRKYYKKVLVYLAILISVFALSKAVENSLGIPHLFKETIGIPLQQIAAVVCDEDGKMTSYERAFADRVIPHEFVEEKYNPYTVDDLKWGESPLDSEYLEKNKTQFLKVWAGVLIKNPVTCLKAHLYETYSYWAFMNTRKNDRYSKADVYNESFLDSLYASLLGERRENKTFITPIIFYRLREIVNKALFHAHLAGYLFWILVLMLSVMIKRAGFKAALPAAPVLLVWLSTMVAAPHAFMYRYAFSIVMCLPFMAGLLLLEYIETKKK